MMFIILFVFDILSLVANVFKALVPNRLAISTRASPSSLARKNGYRPVSNDIKMTPADHMSMANIIKRQLN